MPAVSRPSIQAPLDVVGPDYVIYQFHSLLYKVVWHKSTLPRSCYALREKSEGEQRPVYKHDHKLSQSISRARRVCLELALCNDWKWFATFTIAQNNMDRKNLEGFFERFSEWLKYIRKKSGKKIPYLLVPEQHGDGSWHMHGFFNGDIDEFLVSFKVLHDQGHKLSYKLWEKDYYNWPAYQKRFGFCSFGKIRNHDAAAFYATKYISKSFQGDAQRVGLKLYYCSQGLNRAEYYDAVYGPCADLHKHLQNEYQYCSTGFVHIQREPGDDPLVDIIEAQQEQLYPMKLVDPASEDFPDVDEYYEMMQMCLFDN